MASRRNNEAGHVAPPNGHKVTNAELYKALYDLDQGLSRRFTAVTESINGVRADISAHIRDGHAGVAEAIARKADRTEVSEVVDGYRIVRRAIAFFTSKPGLAVLSVVLGLPLVAQWAQLAPRLSELFR